VRRTPRLRAARVPRVAPAGAWTQGLRAASTR
jgi:hypothetical protein